METHRSLATGQRPIADDTREYPLWPPLTEGDPDAEEPYPLEVSYDYGAVDPALFEPPPTPGIQRWAPLLPPLVSETDLGEGATPLLSAPAVAERCGVESLYLKDESQNPTWSQKDRLNRCAVSAAVHTDAAGVVVSSTGNHGASAAAYAARAGLPCVVLTSPSIPAASAAFIDAYGAAVVAVDDWELKRRTIEWLTVECGYHPVSSRTEPHTGHPFGPEGYKTIAYEIYHELTVTPGTVFVPTAFSELLYGVWKGFDELRRLGVTDTVPRMVPVEPAARGPLSAAIEAEEAFATVPAEPTDARSLAATTNGYRGVHAIRESDGYPVTVDDDRIREARTRLARNGWWQEGSGAAGVAGVRAAVEADEPVPSPVVALATSSGFKDGDRIEPPIVEESVDAIRELLADRYGLEP